MKQGKKCICFHNGTLLTGYTKMDSCAILIKNGKIADIFSEYRFQQKKNLGDCEIINVNGNYISPGFIDTHIHGFWGYGTDDRDASSLLNMSKELIKYGVTAFLPTIYPQKEEDMISSIRACVEAMGKETGSKIMGIHLEGPFISQKRAGVQKVEYIREVDFLLMNRLLKSSEGKIINMTVAPEIHNMREMALFCLKHGIILQAGHTDASYENIKEGVQAGIMHSTHFFNAMSRLHHRDPGAVGAIMIHPEISCEIIADGRHVHPKIIGLLLKEKPIDQIVLVTDALKPTEQKTGVLYANNEEVYLENEVFYRKKDGVMAGSSLTMLKGIKNLCKYGISLENAIKMACANPARIMNFKTKGTLMPGKDADVVVFSKDFTIQHVVKEGVKVI